jgi:hypothetical protein
MLRVPRIALEILTPYPLALRAHRRGNASRSSSRAEASLLGARQPVSACESLRRSATVIFDCERHPLTD